jgi:hypothetical protein
MTKIFFCLVLISSLTCCKVSLSGGNFGDAKTISVSFFQNNAPLVQPTLSQAFTEDLRLFFQTQTPLSIIQKNGDFQFEGSITDYRVAPVAIANQTASSNRLTISVMVKFSNTKDESKDFETTFSRFADFPSSQNLGSIESDLIKQINQQLAQDIFNKAFINW